MARAMPGIDKSERLLILAVDIDNDLYRKTKIGGPLLGRVQNLNGATQLALADPEDTDSNTMFQAVKMYDELKEAGYSVSIATLTGAEHEGYYADRELASQLDHVLEQTKADACVFVTDGASDTRALPIIQSRLKINSMKTINVKQNKALESTYITILEKLKEPHYARIIFGIPAILFLLFAISYAAGLSWQVPVGIIGLYLFIKAFGLETILLDSFRGFGFSVERMSFVFYLSSLIFLIASLFIAASNYASQLKVNPDTTLAFAYGIEGFLLLMPLIFTLYLVGRMLDTRTNKYMFKSFKYGVYIGSSVILWVLLYSFTSWFLGQIYFSQLLLFTIVAMVIGVAISAFANMLRIRVLRTKNLKNKIVVNELGTLIGKVAGVDVRKGGIIINTSFGNPISYSIDRVVDISDKVVIK